MCGFAGQSLRAVPCGKCLLWTKEVMEDILVVEISVFDKLKSKNTLKIFPSPPWSTAPVVNLGSRFAAQFDIVNKSMNRSLSTVSSALLSQLQLC